MRQLPIYFAAVVAAFAVACDSADDAGADGDTTAGDSDVVETDSTPPDSETTPDSTPEIAPDTEPDTAPDTVDTVEPVDTADTADDTAADTPDVAEPLPSGTYASAGDDMRFIVPAGALPSDWSPTVVRHEGVVADLSMIGLEIRTGPIYSFDAAALFDEPVVIELPYPEVAANEVFVALVYEPDLGDWVFLPHAIDLVSATVQIVAPHFSTVTTAQIVYQSAAACQVLAPGLGAACAPPNGISSVSGALVAGASPAMAMGALYQATAQAMANAAQNAVSAQQNANSILQATTTQGVAMLYSLNTSSTSSSLATLLASGAGGQQFLPASSAPSAADPCAGDPCGPGTCAEVGTYAQCTCPVGTEATGLRCGVRNEPPTATLSGPDFMFVAPGESLSLAVEVADPEGDAVTVTWSTDGGSFTADTGTATNFMAPLVSGIVNATVAVRDASSVGRELKLVINVVAGPTHRWSFDELIQDGVPDLAGAAPLDLFGGASLADGRLVLDGVDDYARSGSVAATIAEKTLIVRVALANTTQSSGGVMAIEQSPPEGIADVFDGLGFSERHLGQWLAGSENFARTPEDNGGPEEASTDLVTIAVVYDAAGDIWLFREGVLYGAVAALGPLVVFEPGLDFIFGLRHDDMVAFVGTAEGTDPYFAGSIDEALVYERALTTAEIAWVHAALSAP